MPRRDSTVALLCCPISPRERVCCDDMKTALAIASDANLVRTALYHYAQFVLSPSAVDTALFRLHTRTAQRRRRLKGAAA